MVEHVVQELHVAHACILIGWRDRADRHSHAVPNVAVAHNQILRALRVSIVLSRSFDSDSVVEVGDVEALNQDVFACYVDTVRVQWEHGECLAIELADDAVLASWEVVTSEEQLTELKLTHDVNVDLKIVHVHCVYVLDIEVHPGRVVELEARELQVAAASNVEHAWSTVRVELQEFSEPPHVALAVDSAIAAEGHILDVMEHHEVPNVALLVSHGPLSVALGEQDCAIDCNVDVGPVVGPHWHHVPSVVVGHQNGSLSLTRVIRSHDCVHEGLSIKLFSLERVVIWDGSKVSNVKDYTASQR